MNATIIAIILFVILCPVVSYTLIKKKIMPWSGGILLIINDDELMVMNGGNFWNLKSETIVKGIYLAGARRESMPSVILFNYMSAGNTMETWYMHIEDSGGVKVLFQKPLTKNEIDASIRGVWFRINAAHPFKECDKSNSIELNICYR